MNYEALFASVLSFVLGMNVVVNPLGSLVGISMALLVGLFIWASNKLSAWRKARRDSTSGTLGPAQRFQPESLGLTLGSHEGLTVRPYLRADGGYDLTGEAKTGGDDLG